MLQSTSSPSRPILESALGVHALRVGVYGQSLLGHFGIAEEVQRHPDQVSFYLVEFLANFFDWHREVVQMALFDPCLWNEVLVVFESFD